MIKINKNKNILKELQRLHYDVEALCNGKGICGKCLIRVSCYLEPTEIEVNRLLKQQLDDNIRLACQHSKLEQDVYVEIMSKSFNIEGIDDYWINTTFTTTDYSLAIDVGTTTVVFVLIENKKGVIIDQKKFINPQRRFGADVLTRIEHTLKTKNKDNHHAIKELIQQYLQAIDNTIDHSTLKIGITGNTTMIHLLCDVDVSSLVKIPYHTTIDKEIIAPISSIFDVSVQGYCHIYKPFSAYIGSDILAGLVWCCMLDHQETAMLIDLGTNGEIVLVHQNKVYFTSTAAGPAFEGVHMSSGVGSISGAIDHIGIEKGNVVMSTIDSKEAIGICGSGYVDAMACLLLKGMDISGYLDKNWDVTPSIRVTIQDVRQFQLAKAAIRSGMDMLCFHVGIDYNSVSTLYIAGGFGKHLNINNAVKIGLIPKTCESKAIAVGNSSLLGCIMWVTNQLQPFSIEQEKAFELIELATHDKWKELFTEHLFFIES